MSLAVEGRAGAVWLVLGGREEVNEVREEVRAGAIARAGGFGQNQQQKHQTASAGRMRFWACDRQALL